MTVTSDVGSTVTLGGIVMKLCFHRVRASEDLNPPRGPRSVFPLDNNKHSKHCLYDDTAPSSRSTPDPRIIGVACFGTCDHGLDYVDAFN